MNILKKTARSIIVAISWRIARRYIARNDVTLVGVVGSVGKTGTKRAIAHVLSAHKRVAWQEGNYNDLVSVPLVVFGLSMPSLFNPFAWLMVFLRMVTATSKNAPDVAVLELGTDGPGQIAAFGRYLQLDYAVITAISHEHMEYFGSLQNVAEEELSVIDFASKLYVAQPAVTFITNPPMNMSTYGNTKENDVWYDLAGKKLKIHTSTEVVSVEPQLSGEHQFAALAIAAEIATQLEVPTQKITTAIASLQSMPGRMNVLAGKDGSVLIDDTYNSSPDAVTKALDFLYALPQKHKIAVLGNMNEMGGHSLELHRLVARSCDPKQLKLLVTIGKDANAVLAPEARERGCTVQQFDSPYAIGKFLQAQDLKDTAILFKGSQNGVFLEEAVKLLLVNEADAQRLVRQSNYWLKRKRKQFKDAL